MELVNLSVDTRDTLGSAQAGRMRRDGFIPGVIYAEGKPATSIKMNSHQFDRATRGKGSTQLYKFESSDSALSGQMALIKDMQIEPVMQKILHVDFLAVHEGHRISVTIPIELTGEAPAVKLGEAILNQTLYEIDIICLPTEIPSSVVVDISSLTMGHSLHASDLRLPAGVELRTDGEISVVTLLEKREEEAAPVVAAPTPDAAAGAAAPAADAKGKDKK